MLLDALGLGLLVGGGLSGGLFSGSSSLLLLLPLYLRVLGGIPGVEDIVIVFFIFELAATDNGDWGSGGGGRGLGAALFIV